MKKIAYALVIVATGVLGLASAATAADKYVMDADHTNVLFFVNHLGFSTVIGRFGDVQGSFVFDQEDVSKSSIAVTIKTASVDTDVAALDDHLRGTDFFDAEKFPDITFTSSGINKTGEKTAEITGELDMHGVTKPVTLNVTFNRAGENPNTKKHVAGFSATANLVRSDFGIKAYVPYVGDDIKIVIEMEGLRVDAE
jgi:polyisoprenoid-binding protein YceI